MPLVYYITHPEVVVNPKVLVPDWGLSETGKSRMIAISKLPQVADVQAVWSSTEQKAREGRDILAAALSCAKGEHEGLGENDRSATGYLPERLFWPIVERFFAEPDVSAEGWETARDAQSRGVAAVEEALAKAPAGDMVIVGHGGAGTLLMCHLKGIEITRKEAAPGGMGSWFAFDRESRALTVGWQSPPPI